MNVKSHAGEWRRVGVLVVAMAVFSELQARTKRKIMREEGTQMRFQDHPFVAFLIENLGVSGIGLLSARLQKFRWRRSDKLWLALTREFGASLVLVEAALLLSMVLDRIVYAHIPYFCAKAPPLNIKTVVCDWLICNLPATMLSCGLHISGQRLQAPSQLAKIRGPFSFRLYPFLAKMLAMRLIVDVVFYAVHRALHSRLLYPLHRRHHEHVSPRLQTNFHFHPVDIFLEASVPVIVGRIIFDALKIPLHSHEQSLVFVHLINFESVAHMGKEVPTVSWFPPLAPMLQYLFNCDDQLVKYHFMHHQLVRCNYSISPWPDKLLGSYIIELPSKKSRCDNSVRGDDKLFGLAEPMPVEAAMC